MTQSLAFHMGAWDLNSAPHDCLHNRHFNKGVISPALIPPAAGPLSFLSFPFVLPYILSHFPYPFSIPHPLNPLWRSHSPLSNFTTHTCTHMHTLRACTLEVQGTIQCTLDFSLVHIVVISFSTVVHY